MTFMILQQHKDNQLEQCVSGFGILTISPKDPDFYPDCKKPIIYLYWRHCRLLYTLSYPGCQDPIHIPVLEVLLTALHTFLSWLSGSYTYTCTGGVVDCSTHIPILAVRILYLYWSNCWLLYIHSYPNCQDPIPIPVLEVLLTALHTFLSWLSG